MGAPAAPEPQSAPHPQPRVVWADQESGRLRLVAHDWEDGHPPSYGVLARHGRQWEPATGEDVWATLVALARWLDQVGPEQVAKALRVYAALPDVLDELRRDRSYEYDPGWQEALAQVHTLLHLER